MSEKYTKYEIVKMANDAYNPCRGCFSCEHYRPVNYSVEKVQNRVDNLFKCPDTGCFYAAELPWDDTKWCWFYPPKNQAHVEKLWELTKENLMATTKENTR